MMTTEQQDDAGAGDILVEGRVQECPFCDEYSGTSVGRHVAHKHPDEWADFDVKRVWVRSSSGTAFFEEVGGDE